VRSESKQLPPALAMAHMWGLGRLDGSDSTTRSLPSVGVLEAPATVAQRRSATPLGSVLYGEDETVGFDDRLRLVES
jgi:hypothetical protein